MLKRLRKRFNPRICKRCDFRNVNAYQRYLVSIHASVKDATDEDGNAYKVDFVSIHASVKDATNLKHLSNGKCLFQSTHL